MGRPRDKHIDHGTVSGYLKEYRRGMRRCRACKDAMNAYNKERARARARKSS